MKPLIILLLGSVVLFSCKPEPAEKTYPAATPYQLERPAYFPVMDIPADNPLTVEGIALGRKLFYEKRLSGDNTLSCAGCHRPENSFTDPNQFSEGIDKLKGNRNSMAIFNLGYQKFFFWDGRAKSLEQQILQPVVNPIEMHESWVNAASELSQDPVYREMFGKAFGDERIDSTRVAKAIAQFIRTMVSSDSKFDRYRRGEVQLTPDELAGMELFLTEGGDIDEGGQNGADCFHCHSIGDMQFSDVIMRNNGLDSIPGDPGLAAVTGRQQDFGKFKVPSLRNLSFTAPYMHDGRFKTLEEVIAHYNSGGHQGPTVDPVMHHPDGLHLSPDAVKQLIAFLKTLDDPVYISNPAFQEP